MKDVNLEIEISAEELKRKMNLKDGYSPIKGKDYFDGEKGKPGSPGNNGSSDTPEQIKEKLETLKGNDRLDKSAIKGLDDDFKKLNNMITTVKTSSFVLNNYIVHETLNVDSSTTTITLKYTIAGSGEAIFNANYEGQVLFKDTHYTVAVNIITPLVAFEDSGKFNITYIRE